jgi:hypothetical protein
MVCLFSYYTQRNFIALIYMIKIWEIWKIPKLLNLQFPYLSISGNEGGLVKDSLGLLPVLAQGPLPFAYRWAEPGDDTMSPYLQVQGGIKMTYQETLALLLPFPHLYELVAPLPCVKLFYLILWMCSALILPFGVQGPRSSENNDCQ